MAVVSVVWSDGPPLVDADRLLAREVARVAGVRASAVRTGRMCPLCGSSSHGRPVVLGRAARSASVSLSRSPGAVAVAVCTDHPVGIDIDPPERFGFTGFDDVALGAHEAATTDRERALIWVRKEAVLKATGRGLTADLRDVRVSPPTHPPRLVFWGLAEPPPEDVHLHDLDLGPDLVGCVAVVGGSGVRVSVRKEAAVAPAG